MGNLSRTFSTSLQKDSTYLNCQSCAISLHIAINPINRKEEPTKILGDNLKRIFIERGVDFFDNNQGQQLQDGILTNGQSPKDAEEGSLPDAGDAVETHDTSNRVMTTEELYKMRTEILPQL